MNNDKDFIEQIKQLDTTDPKFLEKLEELSKKVAQARLQQKQQENPDFVAPDDPQDLLNCEGCQ